MADKPHYDADVVRYHHCPTVGSFPDASNNSEDTDPERILPRSVATIETPLIFIGRNFHWIEALGLEFSFGRLVI